MSDAQTPIARKPTPTRSKTLPPSPITLVPQSPSSAVPTPTGPSPRLSPNPSLSGLHQTPSSPTPSMGGSGASKSRARDLLRKHYGLGIGVPTPSGNPADPTDIDSAAFNAKAYYDQLITTASLPALLKKQNDLVSEIRQLESDRQALVYNHHHELIAANDTIRAMKSRAEGLDVDLEKLKMAFSEISRLSTEVTDDLPNNAKD
ncbi:hypothetical protein FRC03_002034 [Tulasnella sp. 419]|nr:hypothetical protein FRC02_003304 [Tulasnella sp. 418]KAG8964267.1 hypothetical protein FRC03_002034 [Tulasnella sp. 419]